MDFKKVDLSKISLTKAKDNGSKGYISGITYGGQSLIIQTPPMICIYDTEAKALKPKKAGDAALPPVSSITLGVDKSTPAIEQFEEFLGQLHGRIQDLLKTNAEDFFGEPDDFKKLPKFVKQPDPKYAPVFAVKMDFEADKSAITGYKITTPVYNRNEQELVAEDVLKRKSKVVVVFDVAYVHSAKPSLSSNIRVNADRVLLLSGSTKKRKFDFIIDESIEKEFGDVPDAVKPDAVKPDEAHDVAETTTNNFEDDNDDI